MKNHSTILLAAIVLLLSGQICLAQEVEVSKYHFNKDYDYSQDTSSFLEYNIDSLLKHASKHIGTIYVANGKTPGGFDCSGFTFYNYRRFGIILPYYSFQQGEVGVAILIEKARKGDLIVFKGHDITSVKPGHVGIVYENKGGKIKFIHASTSHGVRYDFADGTYFKERFLSVRRIVE